MDSNICLIKILIDGISIVMEPFVYMMLVYLLTNRIEQINCSHTH